MASGFVALGGVDLDDIFAARVTTKTHNVQYYVEGVDISNRYEKLMFPPLAQVTGYEWHGADLNTIFQAKTALAVSYRYLNSGDDILAPILLTSTPGITAPPPPCSLPCGITGIGTPIGNVMSYPGGAYSLGCSPSLRYTWLDSLTVPEAIAPNLDDLMQALDDHAVPTLGEGIMILSGTTTTPLGFQADYDVNFTVGNTLGLFSDFIAACRGVPVSYTVDGSTIETVGVVSDTDSFWALQTAALKAAGLYAGLNQAAPFPMFMYAAGSAVFINTTSGTIFPVLNDERSSPSSAPSSFVGATPPMVLIERVIG